MKKIKRSYNGDKREHLQVRIPSWLKAMMQDELPSGGISEFVRAAIEEKFSNDRRRAAATNEVTATVKES